VEILEDVSEWTIRLLVLGAVGGTVAWTYRLISRAVGDGSTH
jgi:hypothetical protein